jgi:beta-phosphoglucomutase
MPLNVEKVKSAHAAWSAAAAVIQTPVTASPGAHARAGGPRVHTPSPDHEFAAWVLGPAARVPPVAARAGLQAVLFDLDGVLVDTAEFHFLAWQRLASELGIPFDRHMNHAFRGVGRRECLEKLLGDHGRFFAPEEKRLLADRKNAYYLQFVHSLSPKDLAPGIPALVASLRSARGGPIRTAIVSASRNARLVLQRLAIADWFDVIIDGADVSRGKPDPQGFLLAAERLRVRPERCVIVEDAESGARAGLAAGMGVVGIGDAVTSAPVIVRHVTELSHPLLESLCNPTPPPLTSPAA